MDHALDTMATGLQASQTMMDTIADNLANVNTTGFKSETPEFQTLLYQDGIQPGAQSTGQTEYPSGLELGTGVKTASISDVLTQGSLTNTGNPLNMAINGSGYFQVVLPSGSTRAIRGTAISSSIRAVSSSHRAATRCFRTSRSPPMPRASRSGPTAQCR